MPEIVSIRPHHLLCISGYKGNIYNTECAKSWNKVIKNFVENPNQSIKIALREDTLCKNCMHSTENGGTCDKNFVEKLDNKVKELLNLKNGEESCFIKLMERLFNIMTPQKHAEICGECGWRKKGLCKDTFEKA